MSLTSLSLSHTDVHVLLLDGCLVLMQKVDDKMVLKCHSKTLVGALDGKQMLSPIIKLGSVLARDVATGGLRHHGDGRGDVAFIDSGNSGVKGQHLLPVPN